MSLHERIVHYAKRGLYIRIEQKNLHLRITAVHQKDGTQISKFVECGINIKQSDFVQLLDETASDVEKQIK